MVMAIFFSGIKSSFRSRKCLYSLTTAVCCKSRKHFKVCCIFNALVLSAVVCVFIAYLPYVKTGTITVWDSQKEYTQNNYVNLTETIKKKEVDKPLPVPLNSKLNKKAEGNDVDKPLPAPLNSKLNKKTEGNDVDKSLPAPLKIPTNRETVQAPTKARTYEEAKRLLKDYAFDDIINMKPIRYLENFKNPCWMGSKDNGPVSDNKIHCLPYFYLIGVKKSGTSDLFRRINRHPKVTSSFKEAQWFPKRRFSMLTVGQNSATRKAVSGSDPRELSYYVHMFDTATKTILAARERNASSDMITGEGTPANLHLQGVWDLLPGNEGLLEPRYTNLHYIKHLIPQAKIIIIFRNPVDRLYSDFHHHSKVKDSNVFHEQAATTVQVYQNCFRHHSFRHCIYNYTFTDEYPRIFAPMAGFYAFFMKEIRSVFSPNQILPLLFDDYVAKPIETLSKVYSFLELPRLDDDRMQTIINGSIRNSGAKKKAKSGPMLEKTRKMLNDFYRSSNEEMAELMRDNRYLFSEK